MPVWRRRASTPRFCNSRRYCDCTITKSRKLIFVFAALIATQTSSLTYDNKSAGIPTILSKMQKSLLLILCVLAGVGGVFFVLRTDSPTSGRVSNPPTIGDPRIYERVAPQSVEVIQSPPTDQPSSRSNDSTVPLKVTGRAAPVLDWNKYPGNLDSQANKALESHDGIMAMDLANKLAECDIAMRLQGTDPSQYGAPLSSVEAQAGWMRRRQEDQRLIANCQTVVGGVASMRTRLLGVALQQEVMGAAVDMFTEGSRRDDVLRAVARDAVAGDIKSMIYVAAYKDSAFGVTAETQKAIRYAFELAAKDDTVGPLVKRYYEISQGLSVPMGGNQQPKFDSNDLSDAIRNDGKLIAEKLVRRIKEADK